MTVPTTTIEHVPARHWESWRDRNDAVMIDVREPDEWAMGTIPDCRTIALATLPSHLEDLDPDVPILVVCRTGSRSTVAAQWLAARGFRKPASLAGGLAALGLA